MPSPASPRKCPKCGFWLETLNESRAPQLYALASIPLIGELVGALILATTWNQRSEGPFWCWRCKAEVSGSSTEA